MIVVGVLSSWHHINLQELLLINPHKLLADSTNDSSRAGIDMGIVEGKYST